MKTISEIRVSNHPKACNKPLIKTSQDAYELIKSLYNEDIMQYKEIFMVLYLNRTNRVLGYNEDAVGSETGTAVSVKQILGIALKISAYT